MKSRAIAKAGTAAAAVAAVRYLTDNMMTRVRALLPVYRRACRVVGGVKALTLAALHYRENAFRKRAKREGGPFQCDRGGSGAEHTKAIQKYVRHVGKTYGVKLGDIETDFFTACVVAAHILKTKGRDVPNRLADAIWGYNGRSWLHTKTGKRNKALRSWRFSSYVVNDPKRGVRFRIRGTVPDGKGGRLRIDRLDRRPGALVVYRELERRRAEFS